jgi:hypothetical protein
MRKFTLLFVLPWFCHSINAQNSGTSNMGKRDLLRLNSTYVGLEMLSNKPATINGFNLTQNLYGPSVEIMGTMTLGYLTGMGYHADSSAYSRARLMYYDFHYAMPVFKTRVFNIRPELGFRIVANQLNAYFTDNEIDANGIGAGAFAGLSINAGSFMVKFKYGADAAFNMGNNSFKSTMHYGSLTLGVSPMTLFMNPKNFTASGIARTITNYQKTWNGQGVEFKKNSDGSTTKTTTNYYKESWTESYGIQDFRCKDVQPFLWFGPRAITNVNYYAGDNPIAAWGVNLGGRYGSLWINTFYEQGAIAFKEPFKRDYDFINLNNNRLQRMDGAFVNSSRYGGQIGLELVTYLQKKDMIYMDSKIKQATSHFSLTPFVGYVVANIGDLQFYDAKGESSLTQYLGSNGSTNDNDVRTIGDKATAFNMGIQMGIGAAAINLERNFYKTDDGIKRPLLGKWQLGFSYNIPVIRVLRAISSKSKFKAAWEESKKVKDPTNP